MMKNDTISMWKQMTAGQKTNVIREYRSVLNVFNLSASAEMFSSTILSVYTR